MASLGRFKDANGGVTLEYQRTSGSLAVPELSTTADSLDCRRRLTGSNGVDASVDYEMARRSSTKETWSMKGCHPVDALRPSDALGPAPLQRLEQLESELASLNHARRRLAVDNDGETDTSSSNSSVFNRGHSVLEQPGYRERSGSGTAGLNLPPWISSTLDDVAALQRRQMCGGSVFGTSSSVVATSRNESALLSSSDSCDVISSLARYTDSRFSSADADERCPTKYCDGLGRMSDDRNDVEYQRDAGEALALPRTPAKDGFPSLLPGSVAECPTTPINGATESHFVLGMCC